MKYQIVPVTMFKQNCSIVWCEQTSEAALVDPGGDVNKLRQVINQLGVKIKKIILTHGHIDHIGGATELSQIQGVPIIGPHYKDKLVIDNLPIQCKMFKIKDIPILKPDVWLQDKDVIEIGKEIFFVLHCPGHSPGHVVFWNKSHKFILGGDVLFKGSIGHTNLPGGNIKMLLHSIKYKLMILEDNVTILPGHGPISTIGYERCSNPFLKINIEEY